MVMEGNGQFLMLGHFVNQSGGGLYHIYDSPTVNMYICGGEGPSTGVNIHSADSDSMDIEVVNNSYHTYYEFTVSDTSAGDEFKLFNCKNYGSSYTTHVFRGDGDIVVQQDYRGVAHDIDLQLQDNATGIVEGGFMDSGATYRIRALHNSQAMLCGQITVKGDYDFHPDDEDNIYVESVCPAVIIGVTGTNGLLGGSGDTTPPAIPTGLAATPGDNSVSLAWTPNGETDLWGYGVYRADPPAYDYYNSIASVTDNNYADNSVTNGNTYYYVVIAIDTSNNESDPTAEVSATPTAVIVDTEPPTPNPSEWDVLPTAISTTEITMTAVTAVDPSGGVEYRFRNDTTGALSAWQTSPMYTAAGLEPGSNYVFRVKTRDALGNIGIFSVGASATTWPVLSLPAAPDSLSAIAITKTQIDLSWVDLADNETGFQIERSDRNNGSFQPLASIGQNVTSYSDTTVRTRTPYYYRGRAVNADGASAYSIETSATTPRK